jgi:exodeoxyribonuclease V alpha subunit
MTVSAESTELDPADWRRVTKSLGLLRSFNQAGLIEAAEVHVAQRLTALYGDTDDTVALAVALAVRALRNGSVCVDMHTVAAETGEPTLPWPEAGHWVTAVAASPLLGKDPALRLRGDRLLYLDRYFREEEQVCTDLLAAAGSRVPVDATAMTDGLDRIFPRDRSPEQRAAAEIALSQWTTVLTGGPGTGKTTTVAGLLALLAEQAELSGRSRPRIALAAPTGRAAARLQQAVQSEIGNLGAADQARLAGLHAVTVHRLLGWRPDSGSRFKHDRGNRLPFDVIVVDETSMVSLTLMARLLEAVRPKTRLILVGDPDQLTSVDAGAVLADLVEGLGGRTDTRVAALTTSHRFGPDIGDLAFAIREGDADRVMELLRSGSAHIDYVESGNAADVLRSDLLGYALQLRKAGALGDGSAALQMLDEHRLLCAHRDGPYGVRHWNRLVERWLTEETGEPVWAAWYLGRPILVTANDSGLGLLNGDSGVAIRRDDSLRVMVSTTKGTKDFATSRLADVETMHAMTIHKSQGSQADKVTVLLPPVESRLLTRELFYTAVTRAMKNVRIVGSESEVRAALDRRVVRASGLSRRLAEG